MGKIWAEAKLFGLIFKFQNIWNFMGFLFGYDIRLRHKIFELIFKVEYLGCIWKYFNKHLSLGFCICSLYILCGKYYVDLGYKYLSLKFRLSLIILGLYFRMRDLGYRWIYVKIFGLGLKLSGFIFNIGYWARNEHIWAYILGYKIFWWTSKLGHKLFGLFE